MGKISLRLEDAPSWVIPDLSPLSTPLTCTNMNVAAVSFLVHSALLLGGVGCRQTGNTKLSSSMGKESGGHVAAVAGSCGESYWMV